MARDVCLDLGTFRISNHLDTNLVLAVRTSASLSMPDDHPGISSAAELRDQVRSGSIWVTRAAHCKFQLDIRFAGPVDDGLQEDLEHIVTRALESLPVWHVFGVDLRREYNEFHSLPGSKLSYSYSVHHTRQDSGLVCPEHVKSAYLSTISCNLLFGMKNAVGKKIGVDAMTRSKKTRVVTSPLHTQQLPGLHCRDETADQPMAPASSGRVPRRNPPRKARGARGDKVKIYDPKLNLQEDSLGSLTHAALSILLGFRKRFDGFHCMRPSDLTTLLDIAPAVWSAHYFQEIASRAQLAPLISSALGDLNTSKSTRLRQKVQNLASDPAEELRKEIMLLILRSTPARVPNDQRPNRTHSNDHPQDSFEMTMLTTKAHESSSSPEPDSVDSLQASQDSSSTHTTLSAAQADRDAAVYMSSVMQGDILPHEDAPTYHQNSRAKQNLPPSMRTINSAPDRAHLGSRSSRGRTHHSDQPQADDRFAAHDEACIPYGEGVVRFQGWERQQQHELISMRVELGDDTAMYSFREPSEEHQGCSVPGDFYDEGLITDDELMDIQYYDDHDEMYLEAERERTSLMACGQSAPGPPASEYFQDDNDYHFPLQAEQSSEKSLASGYSFLDFESACRQDDGNDGAQGFV